MCVEHLQNWPYDGTQSKSQHILNDWNHWKFCFIDYAKAFDCVDHNKLWKILKEMGIPDHLICLLRNLYAGQYLPLTTPQPHITPVP